MNCKYCQCENETTNIFCINCGKRLGGKTDCPICHRPIPEKATYCPMCGNRIDGKTVCLHCDRVYEGDFCPGCGAPSPKSAPLPSPETHARTFLGARNVLLYLALICMFIGAFLFGGRFVITDLGSHTPNWKSLPDFLNVCNLFQTPFHTLRILFHRPNLELQDGIPVLSSVLLSFSYLCHMVLSFISLICATAQLIRKKCFFALQLQNCILPPATSMLISMILLLGVTRGMKYLSYTMSFLEFRLSLSTVAVLIVTAALLAASLALSFLIRRTAPGEFDKRRLFPLGGAALSLLLLCIAGIAPMLSVRPSFSSKNINARVFDVLFEFWNGFDFLLAILTCVFYLLILILSAILFNAMAARMNPPKNTRPVILAVFSLFLALAAIGYLICTVNLFIIARNDLSADDGFTPSSISYALYLGASPIFAVLCSIGLFALTLRHTPCRAK